MREKKFSHLFWLLLFGLPSLLPAQIDSAPAPNHAFATQMGSGIYTATQNAAQIYRISGSVSLRSPLRHSWGLRLRLPLAIGFNDYEVTDFFSGDLPQSITTLALLPALEAEHFITHHWLLSPFIGFGTGLDCRQRSHKWITLVGLRNQFVFLLSDSELRLNSRLLHSELLAPSLHAMDDFSMFESGIEFRRPLGIRLFGLELDVAPFFTNYIYKISPHLMTPSAHPFQQQVEWELGASLGSVRPCYFFGIKMPRAGLSYRFGSDSAVIRIILGDSFPIDSPRARENFYIGGKKFKQVE